MPPCRQSIVYADDTDLLTLGTAELFIIAAVRLWVADHGDRVDDARWRGAFAAARVAPHGACGFIGLMRILGAAARRDLGIRPVSCRLLGRDEGLLLRLVSLLQRGCAVPAEGILSDWLPPSAVGLARQRAYAVAAALGEAGLIVPLRHAEASDIARLSAYAHSAPGLALVQ